MGDQQPSEATPLTIIARALRRERERGGLSITELARQAGVAKSTVSQLEAANGNPSVETLWALCVVLGIPFSQLVDPPTSQIHVVRAGEGPLVRSEQIDFTATLLASCPSGVRRDIYRVTIEPGEPRRAQAHVPGTTEHLVISSGNVRAGPAEQPIDLGPGDYAAFPGDVAHTYAAIGDTAATAILVMEHV